MTDRGSKGGRWGNESSLNIFSYKYPDASSKFSYKGRQFAFFFFWIIIVVEINNFTSILKKINKSCICVLIVDINRG